MFLLNNLLNFGYNISFVTASQKNFITNITVISYEFAKFGVKISIQLIPIVAKFTYYGTLFVSQHLVLCSSFGLILFITSKIVKNRLLSRNKLKYLNENKKQIKNKKSHIQNLTNCCIKTVSIGFYYVVPIVTKSMYYFTINFTKGIICGSKLLYLSIKRPSEESKNNKSSLTEVPT